MYSYRSSDKKISVEMFFDCEVTESTPEEILQDRLNDMKEVLSDFELEQPISAGIVSGYKSASMVFNSGDSPELTHSRTAAVMTGPKEAFLIIVSGPIDDKKEVADAWDAIIAEIKIEERMKSGGGSN